MTADELFLSMLGIARVPNRGCGTTRQALEKVLAHGYLTGTPDEVWTIKTKKDCSND